MVFVQIYLDQWKVGGMIVGCLQILKFYKFFRGIPFL